MGARMSTHKSEEGEYLSKDEQSGTASNSFNNNFSGDTVEVRKDGESSEELSVHFGYQCQSGTSPQQRLAQSLHENDSGVTVVSADGTIEDGFVVSLQNYGWKGSRRNGSFTSLSGAALGANATLANSSICNGRLGGEILPGLDSPRTFRRMDSLLRTSSLNINLSTAATITSALTAARQSVPNDLGALKSTSAPDVSFLNAEDVKMAGGAAGEDRVQAVCSEDNGWLFCGIYDGFNGRDAADFLAGTLYDNLGVQLRLLDWKMLKEQARVDEENHGRRRSANDSAMDKRRSQTTSSLVTTDMCGDTEMEDRDGGGGWLLMPSQAKNSELEDCRHEKFLETDSLEVTFREGVLHGLRQAIVHTERNFLDMVMQEMHDRPDLVMVGSCVLVVLMHGQNLYTLNLGDSRAVLASHKDPGNVEGAGPGPLYAVQLTQQHVVDDEKERDRILGEHPEDPWAISKGRLKGKLRVTRAFGAGYLKKAEMNNALMGILRVKELSSPPYLSTEPSVSMLQVHPDDRFVVIGSDGLFDFFTNNEVVEYVHKFLCKYPTGDPAKYMVEQLLLRAATNAGLSAEQLKMIPIGRRRKYHDDVTIIVVYLGSEFHTAKASTFSRHLPTHQLALRQHLVATPKT